MQFKEGNKGIISISLNNKLINRDKRNAGFFASISYKILADAITIYKSYKLRDEHEKSFLILKNILNAKTQNSSSELSKNGYSFILFISLIIL